MADTNTSLPGRDGATESVGHWNPCLPEVYQPTVCQFVQSSGLESILAIARKSAAGSIAVRYLFAR